jgi:hypothetical protein
MTTGKDLLKELEEIKKKAEFVEVTYPNNSLWPIVNVKLKEIINLISNDMKIYGYGKK